MRYLGIDWGEKRIGLALGDSETKLATPFKVVGSLGEVLNVIKEEGIDVVAVGKPLRITNYELRITNENFNKFVEDLKKKTGVKIAMMDERLTSKAADALAGTKKINPSSPRLRRARAPRDAVAAMLILQSYFDQARNNK